MLHKPLYEISSLWNFGEYAPKLGEYAPKFGEYAPLFGEYAPLFENMHHFLEKMHHFQKQKPLSVKGFRRICTKNREYAPLFSPKK